MDVLRYVHRPPLNRVSRPQNASNNVSKKRGTPLAAPLVPFLAANASTAKRPPKDALFATRKGRVGPEVYLG